MPTLLSSLTSALSGMFSQRAEALGQPEEDVDEPEPETAPHRNTLVEIQTVLPPKVAVDQEDSANLTRSFSGCREPVALEYVANESGVVAQWVAGEGDAEIVGIGCESWLPEAVLTPATGLVRALLENGPIVGIVEFGLDLGVFRSTDHVPGTLTRTRCFR